MVRQRHPRAILWIAIVQKAGSSSLSMIPMPHCEAAHRKGAQPAMSVHVVADTAVKISALRAMLENQHAVTSELLNGASNRCSDPDAVIVTADLRVVENIDRKSTRLNSSHLGI